MEQIKKYEEMSQNKMGQLCGHIPDYMEKIHNMELDDFTVSRVKGLIEIYKEINKLLEDIIQKTKMVAKLN